ncbi:MAG: carbamoyltransferase HypF, partial [Thermoprotei archaeon]
MKRRAWLIKVVGVVQGVGFRPFVHRLAIRLGLSGYVRNKGGVEVEVFVEGEEDALRKFLRALLEEKPPTAEIEDVVVEEVGPRGYRQFVIKRSAYESDLLSIIPPDFSICDQCLKEILDPSSRWYRYPFNSCAWCGPRFTIIEKVPYDRENTSMRDFPLCSICLSEYEDLNNVRRYHAQGISCPICGPKITLFDAEGRRVEVDDPLVEAARLIDEGYIVAVKGIGGFHIAALASDDEVVMELRRRKRRPQKPFAVMALNLEIAGKLIVVDENIAKLLSSYQRPIVVAPRRNDAPVSELVAPGLRTLGVMLAYSGIHYLLLRETKDKFLIMTSGNPPGEPICRDNKEAFVKLKGIVDYFLMHNRRIVNGADDSVIRLTHGMPSFLRRSRGFVPRWIKLPFKLKKPIIAFGAMLSNCGALGIGKYVIPTQYIGDVDNIATLEYLEEALNFLLRAYRV